MKKIWPSFDLDALEIIIQIVFERSVAPFRKIFEAEKLPVEIIDIAVALEDNNKLEVQTNAYKLAQKLLPRKFYNLFSAFNKIAVKNIYGNNDNFEEILSMTPCISVELIFALFNKDEETVRHAMIQGIRKFCSREEKWINAEFVKNMYLGLSSIISSDTVDLPSLARNSIIPIPIKEVELLYKATQGDRLAINYICDHLGMRGNFHIFIEISDIVFDGKVNLKETCKQLEIPLEPGTFINLMI